MGAPRSDDSGEEGIELVQLGRRAKRELRSSTRFKPWCDSIGNGVFLEPKRASTLLLKRTTSQSANRESTSSGRRRYLVLVGTL